MSTRSKARKRALEVLFEAEQRDVSPLGALQQRRDAVAQIVNPYTVTLLEGVVAQSERIDEILGTYAKGWTLDRMPTVDRAALRIGAWEILFNDDVPDGVAVAEAVALVRDLSTDESPEFVNGLLGRIQQLKPTLLA
ncbi:transcription antitermination factor NusB [Zhihengliuella halotolerans]|uniref:Transcription antitermination protein NusB n=1 Tax=Zhihengliuella halotolerans TaxID=370736 RepID=A0A4Q8ABI4_9MICC|nr:transcription antitermination factor NusB [Zhihengliuella halotolerans]RZU61468.1 NusB antitermination factor [Zhihengliuella halotolerans]